MFKVIWFQTVSDRPQLACTHVLIDIVFLLLPDTLLVPTVGAHLSVCVGDVALPPLLAGGDLHPLCISSEECSTGVARYSSIVNSGLGSVLMANSTFSHG